MTFKEALAEWQKTVQPFNDYSQSGEDGVLEAIFARIGTANKWCVECGASDGLFFSNTRRLIEQGWDAVLIEGDEEAYGRLQSLYGESSTVRTVFEHVEASGAKSLDAILSGQNAPKDIDLAVIDVDGQDYFLFNGLLQHRPRVVVCEFNPQCDSKYIPICGGKGQAGRDAIVNLGLGKEYYPVAQTRFNLIFVDQKLLPQLLGAEFVYEAPPEPDDLSASDFQVVPDKDRRLVKLAAAMSTPRVGFLHNADVIYQGLGVFAVPLARGEGAFWHHGLSRSIKRGLERNAEFILTIDYDTVWCVGPADNDIASLVCLLEDNPDVDVIVPMQQKREGNELLATSRGDVNLLDPLLPIWQGHFGLTLFRASVFDRLKKPWFWEKANDAGEWEDGRIDADIGFWLNCEENGIKVRLSTDVVVGHLEQVVSWPTNRLTAYYQPVSKWRESGQVKPVEAFDRFRLAREFEEYSAQLEMKD